MSTLKIIKAQVATVDPDRLAAMADVFEQGAAIGETNSTALSAAIDQAITGWQGEAADAASTKVLQTSTTSTDIAYASSTNAQAVRAYAASVRGMQHDIAGIEDVDTSFGKAVSNAGGPAALVLNPGSVAAQMQQAHQKEAAHTQQAQAHLDQMNDESMAFAERQKTAYPAPTTSGYEPGTPPARLSVERPSDGGGGGQVAPVRPVGGSSGFADRYASASGSGSSSHSGSGSGSTSRPGHESITTPSGAGGESPAVGGLPDATRPAGSNVPVTGQGGAAVAAPTAGPVVESGGGNAGLIGGLAAGGGALAAAGGLAGRGAGLGGGRGGGLAGERGLAGGRAGGADSGGRSGGLRGSGESFERGAVGRGAAEPAVPRAGGVGAGEPAALRAGGVGAAAGEAGAAGRGGVIPPAGAGNRGGSDDDELNARPDYLVETDDIWGDGRLAAPPVLG